MAHQLKVIADQRGWEYTTHRQVYGVVRRISDEVGGQELKDFITDRDGETLELEADHRRHAEIENAIFGIANALHQNFYADVKPLEQLENEIGRVKDLLEMLKRAEME